MADIATFTNRTIQGGVRETPSFRIADHVPGGASKVRLVFTTTNWPAVPVEVGFMLSFDNEQNFALRNSIGFVKPQPNPKTPGTQPPIVTGFGWNAVDGPIPTHVKLRTDNPSGNFSSTVTIQAE